MLTKLQKFRIWLFSNPVCVALLMLPYFKPVIFNSYPVTDWAFVVIKGVSMLFIAACFLARPRVSPVTIAVGVYRALLLILMYVDHSGGSLYRWVFDSASIAATCLLMDQATDVSPKALVTGMFYELSVLCVINLGTVLAFYGGMGYAGKSSYYFLGMDNSHAFFILPLLTVAPLYAWNRRWPRWVQLLMLLFFSASLYICWAVTGMLAATVFIVLFLLYRIKGSSVVCNICTYYVGILLVFILFAVLRITDGLGFFIEGILHKSMTLSGRTPLWENAMEYIKASPLLGHGLTSQANMLATLGQINCHNIFIQCLFDTGLVGTSVYFVALGLLVRPLMKLRSNYAGYILAAGVCAFLLMLQAEALVWANPFYALLILAANGEKVAAALDPDGAERAGEAP